MAREQAYLVDLSRSTRAVVSKKGAHIFDGARAWFLTPPELRNLSEVWKDVDPARQEANAE